MVRGVPKAMEASLLLLLLLLLCSAAVTAPPPPALPPSPTPPAPPTALEQLRGYLGGAGAVAGDLLRKLRIPATKERIVSAYTSGSAAVLTYTGILSDQLYHWWQGDQ